MSRPHGSPCFKSTLPKIWDSGLHIKSFHGTFLRVSLTRVAIAGVSGYSGQELLRLLRLHPRFKVVAQIGREDSPASLKGKVDLVFLCTPNEVSLEMAPQFLKQGIHVVDLSGAFRLKHHSYKEWYGFDHTASRELGQAEYAL